MFLILIGNPFHSSGLLDLMLKDVSASVFFLVKESLGLMCPLLTLKCIHCSLPIVCQLGKLEHFLADIYGKLL